VNNLLKIVTRQCPDSESILGLFGHQSRSLPLHHQGTLVLAMPVTYLTPVRTSRRYGPYVPGFSYLSNTFSLVTATGAVSNS